MALFGSVAAALERHTYRDARGAGVVHTVGLLAATGAIGFVAQGSRRGFRETAAIAAATYVAAGGNVVVPHRRTNGGSAVRR